MPSAVDNPLLRNLKHAHGQLKAALEREDWEQLGRVDQDINHLLRLLAEHQYLAPELVTAKRQLQQLHSTAMAQCAAACEKLRQALEAHREHAEGRTAYSQVDLLQGEKN